MNLSPDLYNDPQGAQSALQALGPFMALFWTVIIVILAAVGFGLRKLYLAQAKIKSAGAAPAGATAKDGKLTGGNYAGLSKEEMKLLLDAEIKRRQEAGEEVVLRNPFEGPLDWEDVDETGAPRPKAERAASYDEWMRQQRESGLK